MADEGSGGEVRFSPAATHDVAMASGGGIGCCSSGPLQVRKDDTVTPQHKNEDELKLAKDLTERGRWSSARRCRAAALVDHRW
jgi:hypothetical protein